MATICTFLCFGDVYGDISPIIQRRAEIPGGSVLALVFSLACCSLSTQLVGGALLSVSTACRGHLLTNGASNKQAFPQKGPRPAALQSPPLSIYNLLLIHTYFSPNGFPPNICVGVELSGLCEVTIIVFQSYNLQ